MHYTAVARRFLAWADGRSLDKQAVQDYILHLQKEGFTSESRRFIFGVIRKLYRVNNLSWPFVPGDGPRAEVDVYAPALHPDAIRRMIQAAVEGALTPQESAFLALSTVYWLRRVEMMNLRPEHLDLRDLSIAIPTAKAGEVRYHLIPQEIASPLQDYDFGERVHLHGLWELFRSIEAKAGVEHPPEVGWHAIRRTLSTLLAERLPLMVVRVFMGWKGERGDMPKRYYATSFVGRPGGEEIRLGAWRREVDEEVFRVHPFLLNWRG